MHILETRMERFFKTLCFLILIIPILVGCGGGGGGNTNHPAGLVQRITISSTLLQRGMRVNVYTPPGYSSGQRYPVLYAIHGYTANEDSWMPQNLAINQFADRLIAEGQIKRIIIVAPEMDNSWGVNSSETPGKIGNPPASGLNTGMYEDYFFKELVPYIDANYSTITTRDGRYIGGISMGGYIALFYGFAHTDMFSRVGGHSPQIFFPEGHPSDNFDPMESFVYPDKTLRHERDPYYLAQNKDLSQTNVYLDAGYADFNKIECGVLYDILQKKGIPSENHVSPGGHEGSYWYGHIPDYLKFYAGQ